MKMKKPQSKNIEQNKILQYGLWMILFMFVWPALWYTFLIYIIGRQFIPEGGTTPTWLLLSITVLGSGAELLAGLVLLRREGYSLRLNSLRERIRWQWPKGWKAWLLAGTSSFWE
jgi:polyferredoxin